MNKLARKIFSAALAVSISVGCVCHVNLSTAAAGADSFTDLPSEPWYYSYLNKAVNQGFFSGTSATTFSPDRGITRAEAVTVLARVHQEITGEQADGDAPAAFKDVSPNSYYSKAVEWATENGIVSGYGNGLFGPNRVVTHAELAVMFHNYLMYAGQDGKYQPVEDAYESLTGLPGWARAHAQAISGFEIFDTHWDGGFSPQKATTRDEAAALFVRLYEKAAYPKDDSTPRIKYIYHRSFDEENQEYIPLYPLGEEHKKILSSYEEYTKMLELLQSAESCEEMEQPANLVVSEETFEKSNLLAVEVQFQTMANYDRDFGKVSIAGECATVTLVGKTGNGSASTGKSILFLIPVSKNITHIELEQLNWTNENIWVPM